MKPSLYSKIIIFSIENVNYGGGWWTLSVSGKYLLCETKPYWPAAARLCNSCKIIIVNEKHNLDLLEI